MTSLLINTMYLKVLESIALGLVAIRQNLVASRKGMEVFGQKKAERVLEIKCLAKNILRGLRTQAITRFIDGLLKIKEGRKSVSIAGLLKRKFTIGQMLTISTPVISMIT